MAIVGNIKIVSHVKERTKEIIDGLKSAMDIAVLLVENQAKENVNQTPPNHPQVQTGRLRSSIASEVSQTGDEIKGRVGTNVVYGKILEFGSSKMPAYPWLFPALESKRAEILQIFKGSGKVETGKMTWKGFIASRMGEYMKSEGGHAGAMKRLGREWKEYKAGK